MKIKIVSDGTANGTKIVNTETGESIENASRIFWYVIAPGICKAKIDFVAIPLEAIGEIDAELKQ